MRIAYLLDVFPRLSNTFILNQITGMIDRGHEVGIFARIPGEFDRMHAEVEAYRLEDRMRHLAIPPARWRRAAKAAGLLLSPARWDAAVLDALDPRRHGRQARSLAQLYTVLSFLGDRDWDVVHAQFGDLGTSFAPLLRSGALRVPLVTSFRGADATALLPNAPRRFAPLFEHGDLFLPVSETLARQLRAHGCPPERIRVHHSGIDLGAFPFCERRLAAGETARLLFVGRLAAKKGTGYLLEAFARLRGAGRDVALTFVGDGDERATLERRAAQLGVAERVEFAGRRTRAEVLREMRRAHLLAAPSVTAESGDQEGIPNVLKEAMATGMPVVGTRHGGIPELVEDGVSGRLVAERDSDGLARAIAELLDDPERWPQLGAAGRRAVEAGFEIGALNDELEALYRELAAARPLAKA